MNIQNSHEDDLLARVLHGRVDGMSQAPLSFDDVAAKAVKSHVLIERFSVRGQSGA